MIFSGLTLGKVGNRTCLYGGVFENQISSRAVYNIARYMIYCCCYFG
nr:MAG TPA: hypothetical protein [Crassvirales sp.]